MNKEQEGNRGGWGKKRQRWNGERWTHLPEEKQIQYAEIERRVREKMERGEL